MSGPSRPSFVEVELYATEPDLPPHPSCNHHEHQPQCLADHSQDVATYTSSKPVPLIITSCTSVSPVQSDNSSGLFCPPNNSSGLFCPPNNSSGLFCSPNNSSGLFCPPNNSSGLFCPPNNSSGLFCSPNNSSGLFCPPNNSSGLFCPPNNSSGLFCPPDNSARTETEYSKLSATNAYSTMDMPAIIIHSAISTPADEDVYLVDRLCFIMDGVQEFHQQNGEHCHHESHSQVDGEREERNSSSEDTGNDAWKTLQDDAIETTKIIGNTHSSILDEAEASNPQFSCRNPCFDEKDSASRNNAFETGKTVIVKVVYEDSSVARSENTSRVPACTQPRFNSHDSLVNGPHIQNTPKKSSNSNSMDEPWSEAMARVRLRGDSFSSSQIIIRPRSGTLDESALSSIRKVKQKSWHNFDSIELPTAEVVSKSYSDLSGSNHAGDKRDSISCHGTSKCSPHRYSHHPRNQSLLVTPSMRTKHNLSNNHVHKPEEIAHYSQYYLLPETRSLQGARGMRSVSVDDMRMRNGREDYVWKDGKVQLKNGGISHGESVRYVWKDGHVEKITSDANNEDTQVEILETTDSKACSKINPVFVCVFLIVVIAVVVILPIYFSS